MEHNNDNSPFPRDLAAKWLRVLFFVHVASIAVSLLSYLPINDGWLQWGSKIITIAAIVALFQLTPCNIRYRKAAIFRIIFLCGSLVTALGYTSSILTLAASIFSLLSTYQEYSGHSEIIISEDPKLSRNWHSLFNWSLIVGVLTSLVSMVMVLVLAMVGIGAGSITGIVMAVMSGAALVIDIFYLIWLNRMVHIFQT